VNITVVGDRSFTVELIIDFYSLKKSWRNVIKSDAVEVKEFSGATVAKVVFTVVGRQPEEIKQITLKYGDHTVVLDPGPEKFRDLGPIVIYDKGRDFWTNRLRQKALDSR
jgi:hypothetical protein